MGWAEMTITAKGHDALITTSAVFDPYPEMAAWLLGIVSGQSESRLSIDGEGYLQDVIVSQEGGDELRLRIPNARIDTLLPRALLLNEFISKYVDFVRTAHDPAGIWHVYLRAIDVQPLRRVLEELNGRGAS